VHVIPRPHDELKVALPSEATGMFLAKVIGNVVATQKDPKLLGSKLLLIQPYITKDRALVASAARSWPWTAWGRERRVRPLHPGQLGPAHPATREAPIDAVIVGIVDAVEVEGKEVAKP